MFLFWELGSHYVAQAGTRTLYVVQAGLKSIIFLFYCQEDEEDVASCWLLFLPLSENCSWCYMECLLN